MRQTQSKFNKGINRRFPIEEADDPNRLYTLQNARLFARGTSNFVSRIKGYQQLQENIDDLNFDNVYDLITYKNNVVVFWYDTTNSLVRITIKKISTGNVEQFSFVGNEAEFGKLILQEDYIYLSPYNKQLNNINGTWYINDFISTTPIIDLELSSSGQQLASGSLSIPSDAPDTRTFSRMDVEVDDTTITTDEDFRLIVETSNGFYLTSTITATTSDDVNSINNKINTAVNNVTEIADDWTIESENEAGTVNAFTEFTFNTLGTVGNGRLIRINYRNASDAIVNIISGASADGNVTITFDGTSVNVGVLNGDTSDVVATKIEDAILASDAINLFAFRSASGEVTYESRVVGAGEDGKSVDFTDTDSTGVTVDQTNAPLANGGTSELNFINNTPSTGGTDTQTEPITYSLFFGIDYTVNGSVNGLDTSATIATKIRDDINNDGQAGNDYTASINGSDNTLIDIVSNTSGEEFNKNLSFNSTHQYETSGISGVASGISGGGSAGGQLKTNEKYWYSVRYVFLDGHVTRNSFPELIETTTTNRGVELTIDAVTDLDGSFADVEIFRKRAEENFFKIDRISPSGVVSGEFTYTDLGKARLSVLDEQNYIWSKNHRTHDIVRNRYVRANLEYNNPDYQTNGTTIEAVDLGEDEEDGALFNSTLEVFSKPKFDDGTESFFKSVGLVNFNEETFPEGSVSNYGIEVNQNEFTNDIKEVGYYGKYEITDPNFSETFNTIEIYNENVPSIATFDEGIQDKPVDPHIFLGWRYISRRVWKSDDNIAEHIVVDEDWDTFPDTGEIASVDDSFLLERQAFNGGGANPSRDDALPFQITVNVMGQQLTYIKIADSDFQTNYNGIHNYTYWQGVYELGIFNGLQSAANLGALTISLNSDTINEQLSSEVANKEYKEAEVPVKSIFDTSIEPFRVQEHTINGSVNSPASCRIYATVDTNSIYGDFDQNSFNRTDAKFDFDSFYDGSGGFQYMADSPDDYPINFGQDFQASFKLNNIKPFESAPQSPESTQTVTSFPDVDEYKTYTYDWKFIVFDENVFLDEDQLIYFGSLENINQTNQLLDTLGYTKTEENSIVFYKLNDYNIYETLISEDELEDFKGAFQNQIIWSSPITLQTNTQGIRNFRFTNVKNISQDYGEILDIEYINNALLVFCERGVNLINVGEVLTQQGSGNVFVNSSQFLTSDRWILKNLSGVKAESIVQYENMLFFCDGLDVWMFDNSFQNITNGSIDFDADTNYIGVVDPFNKEYRITEGSQTWAYSMESGEWYGPYTYSIKGGTNFREQMFGVPNTNLCEFNKTNQFGGIDYTTIVESVSKDLEEDSIDKLWRKFYLNCGFDESDISAIDFRYGKEYQNWVTNNLRDRDTKNNVYHIGVNPNNQNTKEIYWSFSTTVKDFVLSLVSANFSIRKRR